MIEDVLFLKKQKISNSLNKYFNSLTNEEKIMVYGKSGKKLIGRKGTNTGKKASELTRKKLSDCKLGHITTDETKDKIRNKMMNRKITWGDKISKSNKGR